MAIHRKLPGRAAMALGLVAAVLLAAPVVEAKPQTSYRIYRVKSGDSLSVIAQRKLQSASRWPRLYALNRRVVGANPHLIYPDQRLRLDPQGASVAARTRKGQARLAQATSRVGTPQRKPRVSKQPRLGLGGRDPFAMGARPVAPRVAPQQPNLGAPSEIPPVVMPPSEAPSAEEPTLRKAIADGEVVTMPAPKSTLGGAPATAPNPWVAAGASLALPGAGQAYVGDWGRGAIYAGAAAALYGVAIYGMQTQNQAMARTGGYGLLGLSVAAPIDAFLGAKQKEALLASEAVKMGAK